MESKEFSKAWFNTVREEVEELLHDYSTEKGFDLQMGKIDYIPGLEFTMQLQFRKKATEGSDPQKDNWNMYCERYNLTPDMYGKTIIVKGKKLKVTALNRNARTRVVGLIGEEDHKQYSMDADSLRRVLGIGTDENNEKAKHDWDMGAFVYGLKGVPFGVEFQFRGERYKAVEFNHNVREYNVIAEKLKDGRRYKFKPSDVLDALK